MTKTNHRTFVFFLRVDFDAAEFVVGQEAAEVPDGNPLPGQTYRCGELVKNLEVRRLCEWNCGGKKWTTFKRNQTSTPWTRHIPLFVSVDIDHPKNVFLDKLWPCFPKCPFKNQAGLTANGVNASLSLVLLI